MRISRSIINKQKKQLNKLLFCFKKLFIIKIDMKEIILLLVLMLSVSCATKEKCSAYGDSYVQQEEIDKT